MTIVKNTLGVARLRGEFRAVAVEPIAAGDVITKLDGPIRDTPTRYSVQIGPREHVDATGDDDLSSILDRFPWRFLNHACEPNAAIRGRLLIALRPIARMEEVTFHYATTEYDMAEPFECRCGSPRCDGLIAGFKQLSPAARSRLLSAAASHVLNPAESPARAATT
jgi:SET domain-containing protein